MFYKSCLISLFVFSLYLKESNALLPKSCTHRRLALAKPRLSMFHNVNEFLIAAEVKPDDYVYGAVAAPGWVLPLAAVLAVLTAAVPFLLRPGEEALEQMRVDESTTGNEFGKGTKRRKDV